MKTRRICLFLVISLMITSILSGCGGEKTDGSAYKLYYMNMDMTGIVSEGYDLVNTSQDSSNMDIAKELLERLQGEPETTNLRQTIPGSFEYQYTISGYMFNLNLKGDFYGMSSVEQVLTCAAIVKTIVQLSDITYVNFLINGEPLVDANGNTVGSLSERDFVENTAKQINLKQSADITLYFADANDTSRLKKESVHVTYTNKTLEKVIMEKLIEGPSEETGMRRTVPVGTKIINSSIFDGICYINLNDTFLNNQDNEVTEEVLLYSIVNSLCSLEEVSKVQISVNGETTGKIRYNYDLSNFYEADEDLMSGDAMIEPDTEIGTEFLGTTEEEEADY